MNQTHINLELERRDERKFGQSFRPARVRRPGVPPGSGGAWVRQAAGHWVHPSALRPKESGFALAWWALFIGLAAFPLLVFVVEGSRYLQAAGAVQKAADAAAEAAVREIDVPHYVETGEIRLSGNEYAMAEQYANANADYLHARQIAIVIQSIAIDEAEDTVRVSAWADVSALFPAIAPQVNIRREGTAQVRLTAR